MPTLQWIGKDKVVTHHNDVSYRVLDRKYTFGDTPNSGNMIIHGDNLEALKALLPEYQDKIKCIYIDPPYNTGNEGWVYNDNVNDPHIQKWLKDIFHEKGITTDDLTRHDKWLCMMYPRLVLLQKLLHPEGAIFISIDDNEQANLKSICDEIFGANNFVGLLTWMRTATASNLSHTLRSKMEYVLCYKKGTIGILNGGMTDGGDIPLLNASNSISEASFSRKSLIVKLKDGIYKAGKYDKVELLKDFVVKDGIALSDLIMKGHFKWTQNTINEEINNGTTFLIKTDKFAIRFQRTQKSIKTPSNLITKDECGVGTNEEGYKTIMDIFGKSIFDYSKPCSLIEYLINFLCDKDSIILDSFAGSGTTAHAVLNLNRQDGGNRKFILCEMCDYAENITAERVRRVMKGYGEGKDAVEGTGGSFDFYELGETIFDPVTGNLNDNADTEAIRRYLWFSETNSAYIKPGKDAHPYLLGSYQHNNYYFYYIKGEETCLDWDFLNTFTQKDKAEMYIIYADRCVLTEDEMQRLNIVFKKIPRDIKRV